MHPLDAIEKANLVMARVIEKPDDGQDLRGRLRHAVEQELASQQPPLGARARTRIEVGTVSDRFDRSGLVNFDATCPGCVHVLKYSATANAAIEWERLFDAALSRVAGRDRGRTSRSLLKVEV